MWQPDFTVPQPMFAILQVCTIKPLRYSADMGCEPAQCTSYRRLNQNVTVTEECSS